LNEPKLLLSKKQEIFNDSELLIFESNQLEKEGNPFQWIAQHDQTIQCFRLFHAGGGGITGVIVHLSDG
jgi:hypothetical protein